MTADEVTRFWTETGHVAAAIETTYDPAHVNVQVLGNAVPHVHAHLVCRHDPDPSPSLPLSAEVWASAETLKPAELEQQVERLRTAMSVTR